MATDNTDKKALCIYLDESEIQRIDELAEAFTLLKIKQDIENKIPPSRRGRKVSRTAVIRKLISFALDSDDFPIR